MSTTAPLTTPPVSLETVERVTTVTMNDKGRRNALSPAMLAFLTAAFREVSFPEVRAVVLRAAPGSTVWCAGFDIGELAPGVDPLAQGGPLQGLFRAIAACPAPVIAMLNGSAWGGGADLALRCDIALGHEGSSLAFTPARLGLPYDPDGLLNVLNRAGLSLAMEMFATGEPIDAARAERAGLLNRVVAEAELEGAAMAMARRIAANAPLSVASAKRQLRALNAALPLPAALVQAIGEQRRAALESADFAEGLAAFRGKRKPDFRGS